jgi:hypothetical protein
MSDLIFDTPWWFPVLIFTIGAFIFVTGNRRQHAGTRNAGAGVLFVGLLIVLLTIFVDTPKKLARRESKQLIQDAVEGDWNGFQSLLAPNVSLRMMGSSPMGSSAKELTDIAREGTTREHLKAAHIRSLEVVQNGGLVTASISLLTEQEAAEAPIFQSAWEFDFQQSGSDWRIVEIRATQIGELSAADAEHLVPRK